MQTVYGARAQALEHDCVRACLCGHGEAHSATLEPETSAFVLPASFCDTGAVLHCARPGRVAVHDPGTGCLWHMHARHLVSELASMLQATCASEQRGRHTARLRRSSGVQTCGRRQSKFITMEDLFRVLDLVSQRGHITLQRAGILAWYSASCTTPHRQLHSSTMAAALSTRAASSSLAARATRVPRVSVSRPLQPNLPSPQRMRACWCKHRSMRASVPAFAVRLSGSAHGRPQGHPCARQYLTKS